MAFSDTQHRMLAGKLSEKFIRTREERRLRLSYIEGWHAIDQANRIFGFEGWDRETVWAERVREDGRKEPKACAYGVRVRVRIRVRAGDTIICTWSTGAMWRPCLASSVDAAQAKRIISASPSPARLAVRSATSGG